MVFEQKIETIIELFEKVAIEEIFSKFRDLDSAEISSKESESDLVTVVDKRVENYLSESIQKLFPSALVIGEEMVSENPNLLKQIESEDLVFIIDPIDGTWNFANGIPLFGIMISVIIKGETVYGIIYDPINFDYIHAFKGGGSWVGGNLQMYREKQTVSNLDNIAKSIGFIPYYKFGDVYNEDYRDRLLQTFSKFDRVMSFRCSAHEYRIMVTGGAHFNLTSNAKPWDHLAGSLILEEAGGVTKLLTGEKYNVSYIEGILLSANNEDIWQKLREEFIFLERN